MSSQERSQARARRIQQIISESEQISVVLVGVALAVAGWSGLIWVLTNALPTVPNRWTFFVLLHIALTGTALPFVRLLHQRFSKQKGRLITPAIMLRQATWFGLFGTACAWLQIPRLLSLPTAIIIILALVIIEGLLILRERTQWRPD